MCKDKLIGALVFLVSIAAAIAYAYGILFYPGLTLVLLVSLGVAFLLFILAWLGLEMMRTPALEEFEESSEAEEKAEEKSEEKPKRSRKR